MTNTNPKSSPSSTPLPQEERALSRAEDFIAMGHTPMMAQYHAVKAAHPDCLLFYRMGDFYEMFFDDAIVGAKILDLTLTKRGKTQGDDIPMCGVPFHAAETYIARLIRAGQKVAICDQIETPEQAKQRGGYKALVRREVIRIITAGTLIEDNLLDSKTNNYLAALVEINGQAGLAFADVSTGEFLLQTLNQSDAKSALQRLNPSEIICQKKYDFSDDLNAISTIPQSGFFDSSSGLAKLESLLGISEEDLSKQFSRAEIAAAGALLNYVDETQKGQIPYLSSPRRIEGFKTVDFDPSTFRSLELTKTQSGERQGSLIDLLDTAQTGPGSRMISARLLSPLRDVVEIRRRHDEIETLIANFEMTRLIRSTLKSVPDMERALARLSLNRAGPRDLAALRDGLHYAGLIRAALIEKGLISTALCECATLLQLSNDQNDYKDRLDTGLAESLPLLVRDGGFIASGFCPQLDKTRSLKSETQNHIAALQAKYIQSTGIDSLKITHNNILGFFIEVPSKRADSLMVKSGDTDNPFIHRQTMSNAVRFTTPDLSNLERDIAVSAEKAQAIEDSYFNEFRDQALSMADDISRVARGLASIDVATSMATLAIDKSYTRPTIDDSDVFNIQGGRHPVVEQALVKKHERFTPNHCNLFDTEKLWLLTGPNMAGKSTFLRQNALIAIMAQAGFYVPATSAHIGVVDKIYSRVGASDDLARGHSTFMIEMVETASILQNATSKSLVILDEIGRGTATFDGLSIAWATLEHLHNVIQCRGLFATHYHELTQLKSQLSHLSCYTMDVKDWKGDIIFLHTVKAGTADRSYGIHVAKLAGIPQSVIERATDVLRLLEDTKSRGGAGAVTSLPLFTAPMPTPKPKPSALEVRLASVSPDSLTPRESLDLIYELKALLQ
jgi:DNA mismatch repair protein MutS